MIRFLDKLVLLDVDTIVKYFASRAEAKTPVRKQVGQTTHLVSDSDLLPVTVGLAVGISLVVLFSTMQKPIDAMTDDELRKLVSNQYPQFQALKERYPNTTVERIERYEWATYVHYEATKEPRDENTISFPGPRVLGITLTIKPLGPITLNVICGSGLVKFLPATVQAIKTTNCLETSTIYEDDVDGCCGEIDVITFDGELKVEDDNDIATGVFEPDTTGDELGGGNFATENIDKTDLTIEGLKDAYRQGEQIIFSVNAKGISDNACNIGSPSVYIRNESNDGKVIYWPNPFGFNTAMLCASSEPVDMEWTYGNDAKSEIVLDKPGSYTLVASLEDLTVEEKFIVTS